MAKLRVHKVIFTGRMAANFIKPVLIQLNLIETTRASRTRREHVKA